MVGAHSFLARQIGGEVAAARLDTLGLIAEENTPPDRTIRSSESLLRRTRNLCLSALLEAVRDQTRIVDLKQVKRVLLQPHRRKDHDQPAA